jgi:hypothetical protein
VTEAMCWLICVIVGPRDCFNVVIKVRINRLFYQILT